MEKMKKNEREILAAFDGIKAELEALRGGVATLRNEQVQLHHKIGGIVSLLSDQQGFLNQHIEGISYSLNNVTPIVNFGQQELFHYVELLRERRESDKYALVFSTEIPKISVIIPTHSNPRSLWERTIPSLVSQTHSDLEILLVVDGNFPGVHSSTVEYSDRFGDSRISVHLAPPTPAEFVEINSWPTEERQRFDWYRSGNGPFNYGLDIATGDWIAPFSHDDAMHSNEYERVLRKAIEMKWEYCYAPLTRVSPEGTSIIHSFPPQSHNFGVQGSLMHSSLKMFRYDYRDALVGLPNDFGFVRRMMLCGVRMGTIDEPASDYYPSSLWT
jgi:hypothetical protein